MKKNKFNAIIFKDRKSDVFVYMQYDNGTQGEAYNIELGKEFLPEECKNGRFPDNKIVLACVRPEGKEIAISPKFCVDLCLKGDPLSFWDIAENPEYLGYFIQEISKKLYKAC